MSATGQRDQASTLAKSNPREALIAARRIDDPWFRAQALSWVARFTDSDPVAVAREAAQAAEACEDDYKRSAVCAWEIAALAERDFATEARKRLSEAVTVARRIQPLSSRSEALFLLLQAAARLAPHEVFQVLETLKSSCTAEEHWRCRRALRNSQKIFAGELLPRAFFW